MKIRPVGAELFHPDGRTDRQDEVFRNSANAPKTVEPTTGFQKLQNESIQILTNSHKLLLSQVLKWQT